MGIKKGVNALTKTTRIGSALLAIIMLIIAAVNYDRDGMYLAMYGVLIVVLAWVGSWILDSFVE